MRNYSIFSIEILALILWDYVGVTTGLSEEDEIHAGAKVDSNIPNLIWIFLNTNLNAHQRRKHTNMSKLSSEWALGTEQNLLVLWQCHRWLVTRWRKREIFERLIATISCHDACVRLWMTSNFTLYICKWRDKMSICELRTVLTLGQLSLSVCVQKKDLAVQ